MIRAFLALPVSDGNARRLAALAAGPGPGRSVPEANMHLTLAFLGDVAEPALEDLAAELAAEHLPAPVLHLQGLDLFGGRRPRLLLARVAGDPVLLQLRSTCIRAVRRAGIVPDRAAFRPHVTLRRFGRGTVDGAAVADWIMRGADLDAEDRPGALILYRSDLRPEGPLYRPLAEFPLVPA